MAPIERSAGPGNPGAFCSHGASAADPIPNRIVFVRDPVPSRLATINLLVEQCDAQPVMLPAAAERLIQPPKKRCAIGVVALTKSCGRDELPLRLIRSLKQCGIPILTYEDGSGSWPLGVRCRVMLSGASCLLDSARKDFEAELLRRVAEALRSEDGRLEDDAALRRRMRQLGIVGESHAMLSLFRLVLRVGVLSDLPALITGETGTGKQLLANAIHRLDPKRKDGPFVAVNCGAINVTLAESELFGHLQGSFTGAERGRKGLIKSADGGILFLDEVSELPPSLQTKFLRILQEGRVLGVGADQEVSVDVRILSASNRDLAGMVRRGEFRSDLYHRLNVVSIPIPPVRDRPDDLGPLLEHILEKYKWLTRAARPRAEPEAREALMHLELPGNVRQLENIVRRALVNKIDDGPLTLGDLPSEVWEELDMKERAGWPMGEKCSGGTPAETESTAHVRPTHQVDPLELLEANDWNLSRSIHELERALLQAALEHARGNQSEAARLLGITPRSVYNKLRRYQGRLDSTST